MTTLSTWAARWNIPTAAINELRSLWLQSYIEPARANDGFRESDVQNAIRIQASTLGWRLWRNNRGAGKLDSGNFVRFGLANDSAAMDKHIKSHDLIGIRPILIEPMHVGLILGQFVSIEVKEPGWTYKGSDRESAQMRWAQLVIAMGGYSIFSTGGL